VLYERGPFAVSLPGSIDTDSYSELTGATSLVTQTAEGTVVSLCVIPATSIHLVDQDLGKGKFDSISIVESYRLMFPALRDVDLAFCAQGESTAKGIAFDKPRRLPFGCAEGRVWRLPRCYAVAYLLAIASTSETALAVTDRVQASLVERSGPEFPPDKRATRLQAAVPDDWILAFDDIKKKYWVSPTGRAFLLVSHPLPAPSAALFPRYGMTAEMAKTALVAFEDLSGRKATVADSVLRFDLRLWTVISRARGTVAYKSGTFTVEMDRWIDPRTGSYHRVYIGGRTAADFEQAKKIRDGLTFVWAEAPLPGR
jgi:hypothetical protein